MAEDWGAPGEGDMPRGAEAGEPGCRGTGPDEGRPPKGPGDPVPAAGGLPGPFRPWEPACPSAAAAPGATPRAPSWPCAAPGARASPAAGGAGPPLPLKSHPARTGTPPTMKILPFPSRPSAAAESASDTRPTRAPACLETGSGAEESLAARAARSPARDFASPAACWRSGGGRLPRGLTGPGSAVRNAIMPGGPGPGSARTTAA